MGSYAQCWLDDLFVGSSKNDIDVELISLFRARDKVVRSSPLHGLPSHLEHYAEFLDENPELSVVYYEAPIGVVRDRLDVLGYDLDTAKGAFSAWVNAERERAEETAKEWGEIDSEQAHVLVPLYRKEYEILSGLTPETWIEGLNEIRAAGLKTNYYGRYEGPYEDTAVGYMLSHDWYGYPGYDLLVPLRLAMEACENGQKLIYDMTDLVCSGYFEYDEDFVEYGVKISASEYGSKSKIIVLTEGKTDAWILTESLVRLYPHLNDYFSFLDFESSGFGGGVGNLANLVKAFAGAGIVNNVIALFDNDTAAATACKGLQNIDMPPNIAIMRLPELDLLRNYPTIGPSGSVNLDVNGIAASIELYLGEDVLKLDGRHLAPVQWTGYDKSAKKYQGEVLDKPRLHARFSEKLERTADSGKQDWQGIRAVLHLLFTAFTERNRRTICSRAHEYYGR